MSARTATARLSIDRRHGFAFAPGGRRAASVGVSGDVAMLETWDLTRDESVRHNVPGVAVDRDTAVLPLDDGCLILFRRSGNSTQHHDISLYDGSDEKGVPLGSITAAGGFLLPGPGGAVAVTIDPQHSTLWRVTASPPGIELLLRIPGVLSGGAWIDQARGQLALNRTPRGGRTQGIVVDLTLGSWRCTWSISDTSSERILLYAPETRLLVVSSNADGEPRLGYGVLGEGTIRFPEVLHRPGFPRHALAVDDRGERILVHEARGAISRLFLYTPSDDQLTPLNSPRGVISSPACWTDDTVHVPFSCPTRPRGPGTFRIQNRFTRSNWSLPRATAAIGAELVEVSGAEGPVEAIAYGGPNWRRSERMVIALHGGPMSAWRFEFHPLFQRLASAGFAVMAPNCRGSTGYGPEYTPTQGGWGGPDLEDVRALADSLARDRANNGLPAPLVLGGSYGGYLALLTACTDAHLWSGCVALAPFLSPAALHTAASDGVRHRITDLGGLEGTDHNVLEHCASLRVPLLLIHGTRDERIPVEQSRTLQHRLMGLGSPDIDYLELDTDHAGVVGHWPPHLLHRVEDFCLNRTIRGAEQTGERETRFNQ